MIAGLGLVAPLAACGQTDTGANAVSQPQAYSVAAKTLPDHIVNGDFEYPSIAGHATGKIMDGYAWWAYILPDEGASQTDQRKAPKTITEFDANRFGWKSLGSVKPTLTYERGALIREEVQTFSLWPLLLNGYRYSKARGVHVQHQCSGCGS